MTYTYHTLQDWNGNNTRWPSQVYTERNEEGLETRKLILHADGGISFASEGIRQGTCWLASESYVPHAEEGSQEARSMATVISQTEFENTWNSHVYHPD